jgi:hypothetical protein
MLIARRGWLRAGESGIDVFEVMEEAVAAVLKEGQSPLERRRQ